MIYKNESKEKNKIFQPLKDVVMTVKH